MFAVPSFSALGRLRASAVDAAAQIAFPQPLSGDPTLVLTAFGPRTPEFNKAIVCINLNKYTVRT